MSNENPKDSGGFIRWVCWHPQLGYLSFGHKSIVRGHAFVDSRWWFATEDFARERCVGNFFHYVDGVVRMYAGEDIEVREVRVQWEVETD